MPDVGCRVIGNDVVDEVFAAGVDELVRLAGRTHQAIARGNLDPLLAGAHDAGAGDDVVKLPFGGMAVKRKVRRARTDPKLGEFKWWLTAEPGAVIAGAQFVAIVPEKDV